MKYLITIALFVICHVSAGFDSTVKNKVFEIYKKEADLYLKTFARNSFSGTQKDIATQNAILAQYNMLKAKIMEIENKVDKILSANPDSANDKKYVAKLLSALYAETFPGLPAEFWSSVNKKVKVIEDK